MRAIGCLVLIVSSLWGPAVPVAAADAAAEELVWTRYGTGLVKDLDLADLDGDGRSEVVAAGRGVGVVSPDSLTDGRYRWANKWEGGEEAGDGEVAQQVRVVELTGDATPDVVAGTDRELLAIDGATGETLWTARGADTISSLGRGAWRIAVGEWTGDATPDVAFASIFSTGITAVDGSDGSQIWFYPRNLGGFQAFESADVNGDGFTDVVAAGYVDAGFEVHAISGLAARSGVPAPLWVQKAGGDPTVLAIGDVTLDSNPEVIVGDTDGGVSVLEGRTGAPLSAWEVSGGVTGLALAAVDGEPPLDVVASGSGGVAAAHAGDGTPLWSLNTPAPAWGLATGDLDGDGGEVLAVVGGWRQSAGVEELDGFAMAVEPSAEGVADGAPEVRWIRRLPDPVEPVVVGEALGERVVVIGELTEGWLHAFGPEGDERWAFRTGGRVERIAAADLDGDGSPEVVESGSDATVAAHDAYGRTLWRTRIPGIGAPTVQGVAAGDLLPDAGLEVAAVAWQSALHGPPGSLHVFEAGGDPAWSRFLPGYGEEVGVADLEGDGATDIVVVTVQDGSVGRYRGDGGVVWERPLDTGLTTSLELFDATGDGVLDLLITRAGLFDGTVWALDGRTGDILWRHDDNASFRWVSGSAVGGVVAGDLAGRVVRLDAATGEVIWKVDPGSASDHGAWSVDASGDGVPDALVASRDATVRLLSGSDGSVIWSAPVDELDAATVATVRAGGAALVAVGGSDRGSWVTSAAYLLDAATGERLAKIPTESFVMQLVPVDLDGDGDEEVLAAAGWQLRAIRP